MGKQAIIDGANEYAAYLASHIPQLSEDGKIKYYFSGSLAMILLSSAKNLSFMGVDSNGDINFISPQVQISEESRAAFKKGVRPISIDIDIINVDSETFDGKGKIYHLGAIKEHCGHATDLCPAWSKAAGTMYFDPLSDDRNFKSHSIAAIEIAEGEKILITNPVDLILHKLSETLMIQDKPKQADKYEKDLKDFATLFNGLTPLDVIPENLQEYLSHITQNNPDSAISGLVNKDYEKQIVKMLVDIKTYINKQNLSQLQNFVLKLKTFNKEQTSTSQPQ